ncbi:Dicer-like protein 1 [Zancudomyces culisetae]|uniref:Dicer-like protein 1 n=1 Tax=Zancudomyces culisetae TaxID=1213189 RepID=A0A1R1PR51_ZANCU|nr:Dicer-like protein 1 [Zancudomyces culisetae]|eukprot:OMH83450.1 Dicer-like protein 1 [Zancudomyces culisetae]
MDIRERNYFNPGRFTNYSHEKSADKVAVADEEYVDAAMDIDESQQGFYEAENEVNDANDAEFSLTNPREYQKKLFDETRGKSAIVVLETGAGKTLIACMLIKYMKQLEVENSRIEQVRNSDLNRNVRKGKVFAYLCNTTVLVEQQGPNIKRETCLSVRIYTGGGNHVGYKKKEWEASWASADVHVMTGQILLNCLRSGYIRISDLGLLVFDECHHSRKSSPYSLIMREFYDLAEENDRPRVYGMTASPANSNEAIMDSIQRIEQSLRADIYGTDLSQSLDFCKKNLKYLILDYTVDSKDYSHWVGHTVFEIIRDIKGFKFIQNSALYTIHELGEHLGNMFIVSLCDYWLKSMRIKRDLEYEFGTGFGRNPYNTLKGTLVYSEVIELDEQDTEFDDSYIKYTEAIKLVENTEIWRKMLLANSINEQMNYEMQARAKELGIDIDIDISSHANTTFTNNGDIHDDCDGSVGHKYKWSEIKKDLSPKVNKLLEYLIKYRVEVDGKAIVDVYGDGLGYTEDAQGNIVVSAKRKIDKPSHATRAHYDKLISMEETLKQWCTTPIDEHRRLLDSTHTKNLVVGSLSVQVNSSGVPEASQDLLDGEMQYESDFELDASIRDRLREVAISINHFSKDNNSCKGIYYKIEETEAQLTLNSASATLIQYIQSLPRDDYIKPIPNYTLEQDSRLGHRTVVSLSSNAAVRMIAGPWTTLGQKLSKRLAQFYSVIVLYYYGALNDYLGCIEVKKAPETQVTSGSILENAFEELLNILNGEYVFNSFNPPKLLGCTTSSNENVSDAGTNIGNSNNGSLVCAEEESLNSSTHDNDSCSTKLNSNGDASINNKENDNCEKNGATTRNAKPKFKYENGAVVYMVAEPVTWQITPLNTGNRRAPHIKNISDFVSVYVYIVDLEYPVKAYTNDDYLNPTYFKVQPFEEAEQNDELTQLLVFCRNPLPPDVLIPLYINMISTPIFYKFDPLPVNQIQAGTGGALFEQESCYLDNKVTLSRMEWETSVIFTSAIFSLLFSTEMRYSPSSASYSFGYPTKEFMQKTNRIFKSRMMNVFAAACTKPDTCVSTHKEFLQKTTKMPFFTKKDIDWMLMIRINEKPMKLSDYPVEQWEELAEKYAVISETDGYSIHKLQAVLHDVTVTSSVLDIAKAAEKVADGNRYDKSANASPDMSVDTSADPQVERVSYYNGEFIWGIKKLIKSIGPNAREIRLLDHLNHRQLLYRDLEYYLLANTPLVYAPTINVSLDYFRSAAFIDDMKSYESLSSDVDLSLTDSDALRYQKILQEMEINDSEELSDGKKKFISAKMEERSFSSAVRGFEKIIAVPMMTQVLPWSVRQIYKLSVIPSLMTRLNNTLIHNDLSTSLDLPIYPNSVEFADQTTPQAQAQTQTQTEATNYNASDEFGLADSAENVGEEQLGSVYDVHTKNEDVYFDLKKLYSHIYTDMVGQKTQRKMEDSRMRKMFLQGGVEGTLQDVEWLEQLKSNIKLRVSSNYSHLNLLPGWLLRAALTMSISNEDINYQRLEILGDCVLRLIMATQLFAGLVPLVSHEGVLSSYISLLVSNETLSKLCKRSGLYFGVVPLSMQKKTFFPPGPGWRKAHYPLPRMIPFNSQPWNYMRGCPATYLSYRDDTSVSPEFLETECMCAIEEHREYERKNNLLSQINNKRKMIGENNTNVCYNKKLITALDLKSMSRLKPTPISLYDYAPTYDRSLRKLSSASKPLPRTYFGRSKALEELVDAHYEDYSNGSSAEEISLSDLIRYSNADKIKNKSVLDELNSSDNDDDEAVIDMSLDLFRSATSNSNAKRGDKRKTIVNKSMIELDRSRDKEFGELQTGVCNDYFTSSDEESDSEAVEITLAEIQAISTVSRPKPFYLFFRHKPPPVEKIFKKPSPLHKQHYPLRHKSPEFAKISNKAQADLVESILGAAYKMGREHAAFITAKKLGLVKKEWNVWEDMSLSYSQTVHKYKKKRTQQQAGFNEQPSINTWFGNDPYLQYITSKVEKLQRIIGYRFKDPSLAIEATTHASISTSKAPSYQRLEFLGDSVLAFLTTRYYFDEFRYTAPLTPHQITLAKHVAVSNDVLGLIAQRHNLVAFLEYNNDVLDREIRVYCSCIEQVTELYRKRSDSYTNSDIGYGSSSSSDSDSDSDSDNNGNGYSEYINGVHDTSVGETDVPKWLDLPPEAWKLIPAPKVLGDLTESIFGAVYTDSGFSVDSVTKLFEHLIVPFLDRFIMGMHQITLNPIIQSTLLVQAKGCCAYGFSTFNIGESGLDYNSTIVKLLLYNIKAKIQNSAKFNSNASSNNDNNDNNDSNDNNADKKQYSKATNDEFLNEKEYLLRTYQTYSVVTLTVHDDSNILSVGYGPTQKLARLRCAEDLVDRWECDASGVIAGLGVQRQFAMSSIPSHTSLTESTKNPAPGIRDLLHSLCDCPSKK